MKIDNVCLCYYIAEYLDLAREKQKFFNYKCILQTQKKNDTYKGKTMEEIDAKLKELDAELDLYEQEADEGKG